MATKIFFLAALAAVTNAGFIGSPAGAPAISRYFAPSFYGARPSYHEPLFYHSPVAYHASLAEAAEPEGKPETPAPEEETPAADSATAAPEATVPAPNAVTEEDHDIDASPSYSFSYDVNDAETGDTKMQSESLEKGVVKGSYSIVDPDGIKRTVMYTADDINGFNAVIHTEPSNVVIKTPVVKAVASAPVATKTVIAAAPALYQAAPFAYHAPIAKVIAPINKFSYSTSSIAYNPAHITYPAVAAHHKIIY